MFVNCKFNGVYTRLLLDTGASKTIVSKKLFDEIPTEVCPQILQDVHCPRLELADGTPLATHGCVRAQIELESVVVEHVVIVADIKDPGILGFDFLQTHNCQMDLGSCVLTIGKQRIPGVGVCEPKVLQVMLQEDCKVPAQSEVVVPVITEFCEEESYFLVGRQSIVSGEILFGRRCVFE